MENCEYLSFVKSEKLSPTLLKNSFKNALEDSGFIINEVVNINGRDCYNITKEGISFRIHVALRNISTSGWKEHPEIRRIQISRDELNNIPDTSENEVFILVGRVRYREDELFAVWNPRLYLSHTTQCSCYVFVSSFEKAYNDTFYSGNNSGKCVYVAKKNKLDKILKEYFADNYIKKLDW